MKKNDSSHLVLDLGCGYGRIIPDISIGGPFVVGIDIAAARLRLARKLLAPIPNQALFQMDATRLGFRNRTFDRIICIQNGISAFRVEPASLIGESLRVTKPGGIVWFSSYSEKFWPHRLEWFKLQADAGLIGEIDDARTGNGVIVCRDGFRATTFGKKEFEKLVSGGELEMTFEEVDDSSLFCEIRTTRCAIL